MDNLIERIELTNMLVESHGCLLAYDNEFKAYNQMRFLNLDPT